MPGEISAPQNSYTTSRRLRVGIHCVTIFLLLIAIALALLPLLSPDISHLPLFSIQPTGQDLANGTLVNGEKDLDRVHHLVPQILQEHASPARVLLEKETGAKEAQWYGLYGPSISAGVLRICSKINTDVDYTCTSSSQAAYHAALLPLSLGWSLFALPEDPRVPSSLLVSSAGLILALISYLLPLLPWKAIFRPLQDCRSGRRRLAEDDNESEQGLVQPLPAPTKVLSINRALLFFAVASFATALAGVVLQLQILARARGKWNNEEAESVGLEFSIGPSAYLLGLVPISIVISILLAVSPNLIALRHRIGSDAAVERHEGMKSSEAEQPNLPEHTPAKDLEHSKPAPPQRDAIESEAGHVPTNEKRSNGQKSWRQSWRNTFGVGIAV